MLLLIAAALLQSADDTPTRAHEWAHKATPFATCSDAADCDTKWKRAGDWIRENSRFRIVVDEPGLLSTPGAIYANTDLSFTLTKTQRPDGSFSLNVHAWCGNVIACQPKPKRAVAALASAVMRP